jgi:hypothetical protein
MGEAAGLMAVAEVVVVAAVMVVVVVVDGLGRRGVARSPEREREVVQPPN